jgi:hypothetical protein
MSLTKEQIQELFERSKNDRAIIVGSEIRQLCDLALSTLRDREDAERLDFLQTVMLAADFDYGERHESVLVLRWPNTPLCANIRKNIDAARKESE